MLLENKYNFFSCFVNVRFVHYEPGFIDFLRQCMAFRVNLIDKTYVTKRNYLLTLTMGELIPNSWTSPTGNTEIRTVARTSSKIRVS